MKRIIKNTKDLEVVDLLNNVLTISTKNYEYEAHRLFSRISGGDHITFNNLLLFFQEDESREIMNLIDTNEDEKARKEEIELFLNSTMEEKTRIINSLKELS